MNPISFIGVFAQFLCCYRLWSILRDICFCLFVVAFAVIVSFFLVYISGQNSSFSSKDPAATTAAVELIIIIIVNVIDIEAYILLTGIVRPINFYRTVVNSTLKDFSRWSWLLSEMRLSTLFGQPH